MVLFPEIKHNNMQIMTLILNSMGKKECPEEEFRLAYLYPIIESGDAGQ